MLFGPFAVVTRSDRLEGQLGGVSVLQKKTTDVIIKELNFIECDYGVSINVQFSSENLVFISAHLPPWNYTTMLRKQLEVFIENSSANAHHPYPKKTFKLTYSLLGDFNLTSRNWNSMTNAGYPEE